MFYTVTLSPATQRRVVESFKQKTPSLKVINSKGSETDWTETGPLHLIKTNIYHMVV